MRLKWAVVSMALVGCAPTVMQADLAPTDIVNRADFAGGSNP
jgi:hypothetical protein